MRDKGTVATRRPDKRRAHPIDDIMSGSENTSAFERGRITDSKKACIQSEDEVHIAE